MKYVIQRKIRAYGLGDRNVESDRWGPDVCGWVCLGYNHEAMVFSLTLLHGAKVVIEYRLEKRAWGV